MFTFLLVPATLFLALLLLLGIPTLPFLLVAYLGFTLSARARGAAASRQGPHLPG